MPTLNPIVYRRRIALTGLCNSGKTVFLTSLLHHLVSCSKAFTFGQNGKIDYFDGKIADKLGVDKFPYEDCRDCILQDHEFPAKTVAVSRYRGYLRHSGRGSTQLLDFLDVPGERFSDVFMVGKSYGQWCDAIIAEWSKPKRRLREWDDFLTGCKSAVDGGAEHLLDKFRRFLASRILNYQPHISPSTFKLSFDGEKRLLRRETIDELLRFDTAAGVDSGHQFAPLPSPERLRLPKQAAQMLQAYNLYQRNVVNPLFRKLKQCDRLIVLVDIPFLLQAGPAALNDNHVLLKSIVDASAHKRNLLLDVLKWPFALSPIADWRFGGVTKIAFVATKSDLVHDNCTDNLRALLNQMIVPLIPQLDGVETHCFTASSIVSTKSLPPQNGTPRLLGRLQRDASKDPPKRGPNDPAVPYKVSAVPSVWPRQWNPGEYEFPHVYPDVPQAHFVCPPHSGLDDILNFVIS